MRSKLLSWCYHECEYPSAPLYRVIYIYIYIYILFDLREIGNTCEWVWFIWMILHDRDKIINNVYPWMSRSKTTFSFPNIRRTCPWMDLELLIRSSARISGPSSLSLCIRDPCVLISVHVKSVWFDSFHVYSVYIAFVRTQIVCVASWYFMVCK